MNVGLDKAARINWIYKFLKNQIEPIEIPSRDSRFFRVRQHGHPTKNSTTSGLALQLGAPGSKIGAGRIFVTAHWSIDRVDPKLRGGEFDVKPSRRRALFWARPVVIVKGTLWLPFWGRTKRSKWKWRLGCNDCEELNLYLHNCPRYTFFAPYWNGSAWNSKVINEGFSTNQQQSTLPFVILKFSFDSSIFFSLHIGFSFSIIEFILGPLSSTRLMTHQLPSKFIFFNKRLLLMIPIGWSFRIRSVGSLFVGFILTRSTWIFSWMVVRISWLR